MEQKKYRKIIKRIGAIAAALVVAVVAFALPFSARFSPNFSPKNLIASADESVVDYTFKGSTIWVPHTIYNYQKGIIYNADGQFKTLFSNFSFTLKKISENSLVFDVSGSSLVNDTTTKYSGADTITLINNETSFYLLMTETTAQTTNLFYIYFYVSSNDINAFIPNIYKLREWYDWNPVNYIGGNHIRYYDVNDNYLDISVTCWFKPVGVYANATDTPWGMTDRLYYFTNELSESQQYKSGYDAGYSGGFSSGETTGYGKGYSVGNRIGYNNGYSAGVESANKYTFNSLLGAVIDVPVQTFMSLFNFELLGVNLAGFFTGLLTVAFVVTIVKMIL